MEKLKVGGVSKTIDGLQTLDHISLTASENEIVFIAGPSGCGKSTLLNIIAGLLAPDQGQIFIEGEDWTGRTGRVGYMQQKDLLLPHRNIIDNVSIPFRLQGLKGSVARDLARKHLPDFGLGEFAAYYPRQLSMGMRQRASLLRTYLFSSDIMLLDEPFSALDAINKRKMQDWLKIMQLRFKWCIIFVTHDLEEAFRLGDRLYVLSSRPAQMELEINLKPARSDPLLKESITRQILAVWEI